MEEHPIANASEETEPDASQPAGNLERSRRRWFQQPATLFAALALVVSVGSTIITIENNNSQAQTTARQQLFTVVQGLVQAPQVQTQITSTYKDDFQTRVRLGASEANAEQIQAELAAQLIDSLGGNVPPSEAYQVGISFMERGNYALALRYYGLAIARSAGDPIVASGAYRGKAGVLYTLGRLRAAFSAISHAYNSETAQNGFTRSEIEQNHAFTDLYDARQAVRVPDCDRSESDLADATRSMATLDKSSSSYSQDQQQLVAEEQLVKSCARTH